MSFAESIKTCLRKYAVFSGTASRSEYWWFFLFNALGSSIVYSIAGRPLQSAWQLAMLLPGLGVAVRRLHDTARSAWWLFTGLIPPWLITLLCLRTKVTNNPYASSVPNLAGTTDAPSPTATYCPTCGKMRLPGQAYCVACGTQLPE